MSSKYSAIDSSNNDPHQNKSDSDYINVSPPSLNESPVHIDDNGTSPQQIRLEVVLPTINKVRGCLPPR